MTREIFIFIASVLLFLPVVFSAGSISISYQLIFCAPLLLLLGIPHGAIDNILFLRNKQIKNSGFIGAYLVFIGLNIALWLVLPGFAYVLFLVLSAYHFGQSQFSHYLVKQEAVQKGLFLLWGISILSGLVYFNNDEIQIIADQQEEFSVLAALHQKELMLYIMLVSTIGTLLLTVFLTMRKLLKPETLLMEVLVLGLILMCFYLMPLLVGFTLYFVILHSLKVLREEFQFLNSERVISSVGGFLKMVAPFTLISLLGIGLLFGLIYLGLLNLSYGYCLLIVISSITLPHVFIMDTFYNLLFSIDLSKRPG